MKIKKQITETIEADIDLSKPLFFKFCTGNIFCKFVEAEGKLICTYVSKAMGLTIDVSEAYGTKLKIVASQEPDFSPITADEFYTLLNDAIKEHLPLSAEELTLSPEQEQQAENEMMAQIFNGQAGI